ncbi:MAG TPA: UxaA family hydrolase, partial [Bryobacteraceae bacterium]|nr:UxaA family hydrolase [Bryobacteraceae bacterium]
MKPLCVRVHARDNVAIIVNPEGLPGGTVFQDGLQLLEAIPQSHKVALSGIGVGEPVVRYGEVIGFATRDIARGAWVR